MTQEYTLTEMIDRVSTFFRGKNFTPERYSERLYNIRLPLYCVKWKDGKKEAEPEEQIIVDIITEAHINIDTYMPDKHFGEFMVRSASSAKFFQYYVPEAKIFWAYGYYVNEKEENFKKFKKSCAENGIGLLKVLRKKVRVVQEALSLNEILRQRVKTELGEINIEDQGIINTMSNIIAGHQKEYIQYLVFYGEPRFLRRAITVREEDIGLFLNMRLINKLENIQNIVYAKRLTDFVRNYRYESENDHQIAFRVINDLWKKRFGVEYPDIQKDFEVVLLLDPDYRDHFLHEFQVFVLGVLIIDKLYNEAWVKDFEKKNKSKIEDAWLACSTYHDYNYPVQKWDDWMKRFLEQNFHVNKSSSKYHLEHSDIGKEIMRLNLGDIVVRDEFITKLQRLGAGVNSDCNDNFQRFVLQRIAVDKNHAVLGAFTFLEKFQNCSNLSDLATNAAAGSILLHDEPNWQCFRGDTKALLVCSYKKNSLSIEEKDICKSPLLTHLTLDLMPLAFLLTFCDVAQEWGRKGGGFTIEEPMLEDIQIDVHKMMVHISVLDDDSYVPKEQEIARLGRYLKDSRFEIKVSSRKSQRHSTKIMSGT